MGAMGALGRSARRSRGVADMGRCVSRPHAGAVTSDTVAGPDMGLRGEREPVRAGLASKTNDDLGRSWPPRPPPSGGIAVIRAGRG